MTESGKTVTFIGIALALGLMAVLSRPSQEPPQARADVGKPLFENFTDATKAANMRVVRYAEDVGEVHTFEVAKKQGSSLWSIPSHGNYPADAQDQMKDAASCLVGVTILDIASMDKGDHQLFGVIEPNKDQLKVGDKGIGLLVSFSDDKGEPLGRLIIGKEVKGNKEQRFVRKPGQDPVYVAKISTQKLSTKFEDWIEKDLLKISEWDVDGLELKDYSVVPNVQGYVLQPRSEAKLTFDANKSTWNLDKMLVFKGADAQNASLLEGEELNKEKLDDLKRSLNNLKIVDVYPKPKGLGANLRASGDFVKDRESRRSLEQRGFIVHPETNELLSANGELHVFMKEGIEYILRFGNVAGEEEGSTEGKLNRYLFVTAQVDESKFPEPTLDNLPATPSAESAPAAPAAPSEKAAPNSSPPPENAPENAPAGKETPTEKTDRPDKPAGPSPCAEETQEKSAEAKDEPKPAAAAAQKDEAKSESNQPPAAADKAADAAPARPSANAQPGQTDPAKAPNAASEEDLKNKKLAAERERITRENQRKIDEAKNKRKVAEEKVNELNARFADWYYVISEDVYKKIHLSRSDLVKEGAKAVDEGFGVDALRKLQNEGLKKKEATPKGPESP